MFRDAVVAWLFTLIVEIPIVAAVYSRQWRRMAAIAAIANTITNLSMNLLLPSWTTTVFTFLVLGETAALAAEAAVYFWAQRASGVSQALIASALANTASFTLGIVAAPWLFG